MAIFNSFSSTLEIFCAQFLQLSKLPLQPSNVSRHGRSLLFVVREKRVDEKRNILSTKIWNLRKINDALDQHKYTYMYMYLSTLLFAGAKLAICPIFANICTREC